MEVELICTFRIHQPPVRLNRSFGSQIGREILSNFSMSTVDVLKFLVHINAKLSHP